MSYLEQYCKRLANSTISSELASWFVQNDKRAVDYDCWSSSFLSKKFDLKGRGLSVIFRTLSDRITKVLLHPCEETSNIKSPWKSNTERRIEIADEIIRDSLEKAMVMVGGYLECCELLGGPKVGWIEYLRSVGFLFGLGISDEIEEFLKYQSASLCALSLGNEPDLVPLVVERGHWRVGDILPYCKRLSSWLRRHCIQRRSPKGVQLAFSVYATKRIAPAMGEGQVQKSLDKNMKALTTDRPLIADRIIMVQECERTVDELFSYCMEPVPDFDVHRPVSCQTPDERNKILRSRKLFSNSTHHKIPSLAACYENTRSRGGALGYLLNRFDLVRSALSFKPLIGYIGLKEKFVQPLPVYGYLDDEELECLMRPSLDGFGSRVFVRREPILEPFKVRIISKGEAVPYQRAQNYQPFLWKILQYANCFELTGRPLVDSDISKMLEWAKTTRIYSVIVSGDYSAATDNLHEWLCSRTLARICKRWHIPYEDQLNLLSCLTGHIIDNRQQNLFKINKMTGRLDDNGVDYRVKLGGDVKEQIWGQLMGSPVSFPILCIINAAVTRHFLEKAYNRKVSLRDDAFKVNGDDVVFPSPPAEYQNWIHDVRSCGLEPSPGKNYISHRYAVINSQIYDCGSRWDWMESDILVKKVPLVKMNLVRTQQHTSTERRKDESMIIGDSLRHGKTLEGRMKELVLGWDHEMRDTLLKRAYHYAKPVLDLLPPVSWVLPKCLGGLGLPMTKDHVVSELHLKIAAMILCLDSESRRDMVRLQWLKEPGNQFCEVTNQQIASLSEGLGLEPVLADFPVEDVLYGRLIKSNLGAGIDEVCLDTKLVLKAWNNIYTKWVSRVHKIKWTTSKDHSVKGLHTMTVEKAIAFSDKCWTVNGNISWM